MHHINSIVEFPVFSRVYTTQANEVANGGSQMVIDITPPGDHMFILLRHLNVTYANLFDSGGGESYQILTIGNEVMDAGVQPDSGNSENVAVAKIVPCWQIFDKRLFLIGQLNIESDFLSFVADYQLIYNDREKWHKANCKKSIYDRG